MRAAVLLCLLGLMAAVALAGKNNGRGRGRDDNNNGGGNGNNGRSRSSGSDDDDDSSGSGGKSGGKSGGGKGHRCPNCIAQKESMRAQREQRKENSQGIRDNTRRDIQAARNARKQNVMDARAAYRSLEDAAFQTRHATHVALNETLQAAIAAAGQEFSSSLSSIETKVDQANDVLAEYDVGPLTAFAERVAELELAASQQISAVEAAAAAEIAALPVCEQIEEPQGQCYGCVIQSCETDANCSYPDLCNFNMPLLNPAWSSLPNIVNESAAGMVGCCNNLWNCNGTPHPLVPAHVDTTNWRGPHLPHTTVLLDDVECVAERQANETEILDEAAEEVAAIEAQLTQDISSATAELNVAIDAQSVVENEGSMNYEANCNKTVNILMAERNYLKEIAAANQAYNDALVEPKQIRRSSVRTARQAFRERRRQIWKDHRQQMRSEKQSFRQQRRQGKIWLDIVCQRGCPDFPFEPIDVDSS